MDYSLSASDRCYQVPGINRLHGSIIEGAFSVLVLVNCLNVILSISGEGECASNTPESRADRRSKQTKTERNTEVKATSTRSFLVRVNRYTYSISLVLDNFYKHNNPSTAE